MKAPTRAQGFSFLVFIYLAVILNISVPWLDCTLHLKMWAMIPDEHFGISDHIGHEFYKLSSDGFRCHDFSVIFTCPVSFVANCPLVVGKIIIVHLSTSEKLAGADTFPGRNLGSRVDSIGSWLAVIREYILINNSFKKFR